MVSDGCFYVVFCCCCCCCCRTCRVLSLSCVLHFRGLLMQPYHSSPNQTQNIEGSLFCSPSPQTRILTWSFMVSLSGKHTAACARPQQCAAVVCPQAHRGAPCMLIIFYPISQRIIYDTPTSKSIHDDHDERHDQRDATAGRACVSSSLVSNVVVIYNVFGVVPRRRYRSPL